MRRRKQEETMGEERKERWNKRVVEEWCRRGFSEGSERRGRRDFYEMGEVGRKERKRDRADFQLQQLERTVHNRKKTAHTRREDDTDGRAGPREEEGTGWDGTMQHTRGRKAGQVGERNARRGHQSCEMRRQAKCRGGQVE
ncbi:unnamed protein product [Calypogeia fissa]